MAKRGSEDLKKLSGMQATLVSANLLVQRTLTETVGDIQPHQKTSLQKTSHDLQLSLLAFQRAQQVSAERQRTVIETVKQAVEEDNRAASVSWHLNPLFSLTRHSQSSEPDRSPIQRQAQIFQTQLSPHELAYQESLIQEREREIIEIEHGIHELSEMFDSLGTLMVQQGGMIGASFLTAFPVPSCR